MLFGANNQVVYGVGDSRAATLQSQVRTPSNARLELLAAIWARQTGRTVVVAPGTR
jgi:hypothetical protein